MLPLVFFIAWLAITMMWWALAFAPLPATPPDWLVVAREVCFGATPNGLPAAYGWLTLVGVPGSMLVFLLVVWGRQLRANFQTLRRLRGGRVAIAILVAIPLSGVLWVSQRLVTATRVSAAFETPSDKAPLPLDYPRLNEPAPAFQLTDQHGSITSLADLQGGITILTFAFGHCATICPTTVHTARAALDETTRLAPALWVITLDPWRDTIGALPGLASRWRLNGDKTRVLSGDIDAVLAALDAYHVAHQRNRKSGDISHPPLVYIIDTNGRIAYAFNNPSRSWLVEAVNRMAAANPS